MVVGMMIAIEVPTQSCMRTSSGTPRMRKISYSTGTMMAPPPMPNRPARMPVATPADHDQRRRAARSRRAEPRAACILRAAYAGRCLARRFAPVRRAPVHHQRQRVCQNLGACAGLDRLPSPDAGGRRARPARALEQAEQMARDRMQPHAARQLALDIGHQAPAPRPSARRTAPPRRTAADRPPAAATAPDRRRGPSSRRRACADARCAASTRRRCRR